jgi:trigger factor
MEMWAPAEQAIRRSLVVERVAELESLHATPAELDARIDEIAERMQRPRGEVIGQLRKAGRLEELEQEITEEKVFEYLKSLSEIR